MHFCKGRFQLSQWRTLTMSAKLTVAPRSTSSQGEDPNVPSFSSQNTGCFAVLAIEDKYQVRCRKDQLSTCGQSFTLSRKSRQAPRSTKRLQISTCPDLAAIISGERSFCLKKKNSQHGMNQKRNYLFQTKKKRQYHEACIHTHIQKHMHKFHCLDRVHPRKSLLGQESRYQLLGQSKECKYPCVLSKQLPSGLFPSLPLPVQAREQVHSNSEDN